MPKKADKVNAAVPADRRKAAPMPAGGSGGAAAKPARSVCVYCGSGPGRDPVYLEAARTLGTDLATRKIGLVYGGGSLGLMGETARSTIAAGGYVTGIIPAFLSEKERMLREVQELIVVDDMHIRKRRMFEHAEAFVALPGGIGTLEELVEQLTWAQLGQHKKPIVVANIAGFWNPFLNLLAHMRDERFIRAGLEVNFVVVETAAAIVPAIERNWNGGTDAATSAELIAKF